MNPGPFENIYLDNNADSRHVPGFAREGETPDDPILSENRGSAGASSSNNLEISPPVGAPNEDGNRPT